MHSPQLFALVDEDDDLNVFAYGIDTGEEAVTFRRDPLTQKADFGLYATPEGALRLASRVMPGHPIRLVRYERTDPLPDATVNSWPEP